MNDVFFSDRFIDYYKEHCIETDSFKYPFLLINYNGLLSMSSLGYQGPFWKREPGMAEVEDFVKRRMEFINENSIVCEFIRFNPFLANHRVLDGLYRIEDSSLFYAIEVNEPPEIYLSKLPSRTRASLQKGGSTSEVVSGKSKLIEESLLYSNEFFFDRDSLKSLLCEDFVFHLSLYASAEESASSIFFADELAAYYIANASNEAGKRAGANIRLIFSLYEEAYRRNLKFIGLGGGVSDNDSLSLFKKQFATLTLRTKHLKLIHDEEAFFKANENKKEGFFPPYLESVNLLNFRRQPRRL